MARDGGEYTRAPMRLQEDVTSLLGVTSAEIPGHLRHALDGGSESFEVYPKDISLAHQVALDDVRGSEKVVTALVSPDHVFAADVVEQMVEHPELFSGVIYNRPSLGESAVNTQMDALAQAGIPVSTYTTETRKPRTVLWTPRVAVDGKIIHVHPGVDVESRLREGVRKWSNASEPYTSIERNFAVHIVREGEEKDPNSPDNPWWNYLSREPIGITDDVINRVSSYDGIHFVESAVRKAVEGCLSQTATLDGFRMERDVYAFVDSNRPDVPKIIVDKRKGMYHAPQTTTSPIRIFSARESARAVQNGLCKLTKRSSQILVSDPTGAGNLPGLNFFFLEESEYGSSRTSAFAAWDRM